MNFWHYRNLTICVLVTTFLSISPVGYGLVVLNVPQNIIMQAVNETFHREHGSYLSSLALTLIWALIVASQGLGAFIGCFLAEPIANKLGRKHSLMLWNNLVLIFGCLLMTLSRSMFELMIVGRFITGLSTGFVCSTLPLYVAEISPPEVRGTMCCFCHLLITLGSAIAAFLSLEPFLGNADSWHWLLGFPAILGMIQMALMPLFRESPIHLLKQGLKLQANESLKFYHQVDSAYEILNRLEHEAELMPIEIPLWNALANPLYRKGILLGALINFSQIFTGLMALTAYSTSVFLLILFPPELVPYLPLLAALATFFLTLPTLILVEKVGRRKLLLYSLSLCAIGDFFFVIFGTLSENGMTWALVPFCATFILFALGYNFGPGPIAYFICAELVPPSVASASLGLGVAVNWFATMLSLLLFFPLMVACGASAFLIFAVPTAAITYYLFRALPETRGEWHELETQVARPQDSELYGTFWDSSSFSAAHGTAVKT